MTSLIYYIETNLICIITLLLFKFQSHIKSLSLTESDRAFNLMISSTITICISDMVAEITRGKSFYGAYALIELSNLVYYVAMVLTAYFWIQYVLCQLGQEMDHKSIEFWALTVPLILFIFIAITNPITHFLFNVSNDNFYQRSQGIIIHWIINWFYLLYATFKVLLATKKANTKARKKELYPLISFIIAPILGSIVQMSCYGVTSAQVGITLSLVMIYLSQQNNLIFNDSLTGLNNRRGLEAYFEDFIEHSVERELTLMMIDINGFKQINDCYGHREGDLVLQTVANNLRHVTHGWTRHVFLCRFGGDEFLIAVSDINKEDIRNAEASLHDSFNDECLFCKLQKKISVSIGIASGFCKSRDDIEDLLKTADARMYANKHNFKQGERIFQNHSWA